MAKNRWLLKEEPDAYPFEELQEDGSTAWTGVRNNWAQKNMRQTAKGDAVLYYHTGRERAVVGIAEIVTDPYPDPDHDKRVLFDIEPVRALERPVELSAIKAEEIFAESPLVRIGRLSVVPITDEQWDKVLELAQPDGD